jgi:hypothetical protein
LFIVSSSISTRSTRVRGTFERSSSFTATKFPPRSLPLWLLLLPLWLVVVVVLPLLPLLLLLLLLLLLPRTRARHTTA